MIATDPTPTTLVGLFATTPPNQTAIVLPEQDIHITYGQLRAQVASVTAALAGAGIRRGDRVGMAIPNGLPTIVAFLAAGEAGTAAPLNPGYKEEEFRFFLDDTNAKVLLLPTDGADEARRAAGDKRAGAHREHGRGRERAPSPARRRARPPTPRRSTTWRSSCTRAAAPAGPSACRSATPTSPSRHRTWPPATR